MIYKIYSSVRMWCINCCNQTDSWQYETFNDQNYWWCYNILEQVTLAQLMHANKTFIYKCCCIYTNYLEIAIERILTFLLSSQYLMFKVSPLLQLNLRVLDIRGYIYQSGHMVTCYIGRPICLWYSEDPPRK